MLCCDAPAWRLESPSGHGPSCCWLQAKASRKPGVWCLCNGVICTSGSNASVKTVSRVFPIANVPADHRSFPPEVALHTVKIACERPDDVGRSLSHWDCAELARQLVADEVVESISPQTVQRILANHKLKPWRKHLWLSPKVPRDAEFCKRVKNICTLYTRKLKADEMVLCLDEKTSLQPRTRLSPTLAAKPGQVVRLEHEYQRKGALNLFAAFDTRTGKVYAHTAERKRQKEFIEFLEQLDREIPQAITTVHVVLDNLRMHTGKQVKAWLEKHPRFKFHHPPVHCSWMNQVNSGSASCNANAWPLPTLPTRPTWPNDCTRS
jgi:hypothetical protein